MSLLDKFKNLTVDQATQDYQEKAEELTRCFDEFEQANSSLTEGYDADLPKDELLALEDAVTKAQLSLNRAEKLRDSAKRRLDNAKANHKDKTKEKNIKIRNAALKRRVEAAKRLDDLAPELAHIATVFNKTDEILRVGMTNGSVSRNAEGTYGKSRTLDYFCKLFYRAGVPGSAKAFSIKPEIEKMQTTLEHVKMANKTIVMDENKVIPPEVQVNEPVVNEPQVEPLALSGMLSGEAMQKPAGSPSKLLGS